MPRNELPASIEAEQALLGSLLADHEAMALMPLQLAADHFAEPLHGRLYGRLRSSFERGQPIDVVVLGSAFTGDKAYEELGGLSYLGRLIANAPPAANSAAYAKEIMAVSVRRSLVKLGLELQVRAIDPEEAPTTLLAEANTRLTELHGSDAEIRLVDADEALDRVLDYIDNPGNHASGILTGLGPLDENLGPWLPGDLIVLGARPAMGKSAISAIISQNVAMTGAGVIEIHAEMSVEQAWRRRLTATAFALFAEKAPSYSGIRKRTITYDEREMLGRAREELRGIPLKAIKRSGITLSRLRALILRQKAAWERQGIKLGLVSIDHVGLIKTDREHDNRVSQQTEISNGLKEMADELGVPILALAQLSRQVESRDDKRPTLSDLRDSGSWEQDADVVLSAYRDAYYAQREKEPPQGTPNQQATWATWDQRKRSPWIDIGLLKVREGEQGTARVWANMRTNTILGYAPDDMGGFVL